MSAVEPGAGSGTVNPVAEGANGTLPGAFRWHLAPRITLDLTRILGSPGDLVKQSGAGKKVTRHGAVYLKRYRHEAVPLRPLKFFFKPSQAKQEWTIAAELERRGIPAVRHLALGERWSATGLLESVLITEAFEGVPLSDAPELDPRIVLAFVDRMAQAHLTHRDFHPGNLLVNPVTQEIRLVDLYGVAVAETKPVQQIQRDLLGQLCITMSLPVPREIREHGLRLRKCALAARSRRCLHSNRDFVRQRIGAHVWHVRRDAISPGLTEALGDPDAFLQRARMLKAGRSTTVGAADGMVIKRYNFSRWLRPLKDLFRTPRALSAFKKAYHLEICGISTARGLAAANERWAGLPRRGFMAMAELHGAVDLGRSPGDSRAEARSVAALIARLHQEGFSHRDLKETNIVFDGSGQPHLIDLEGLMFVGDVPNGTAASNLQRLAEGVRSSGKLNRTAAVTFLLHYCRRREMRPRQLFPR